MNKLLCLFATWIFALVVASSSVAADAEKYTLRYKFQPGETVRWEVEHQTKVRASVSKTTQTTETRTTSVKAWRVVEVKPDGTAKFEHSVERVDMRQTLNDHSESRYNSQTDAKPPAGFEDVAKSVGVPLTTVTMAANGKVLDRVRRVAKPQPVASPSNPASQNDGWMTIPLPDEAVPIGHAWSLPLDIDMPLEGGGVKKIKAIQQFTLEDVKTGVATIRVSTEILTPIADPAVESQLVQREAAGRVRFDIDAGRVIGQQMDVDKHVVGFRGDASSIHYVNRFTEQLLPEPAATTKQ